MGKPVFKTEAAQEVQNEEKPTGDNEEKRSKVMAEKVADFVVQQLAAWGVKSVYGVVGDALLPFIDAVSKHPDLTF